ncbi:MAG: hypothetical protein ACI9UN_004178 [Granulosicoccus sp.]|jgi:hypothetical protein
MACKQLAEDWQARYHIRPVLVETFVDSSKYKATCYRAANWQHLGESKGLAATKSTAGKTVKQIYVYSLTKKAKSLLINGPEVVRQKRNVKPERTHKPPKRLGPTDPFVLSCGKTSLAV